MEIRQALVLLVTITCAVVPSIVGQWGHGKPIYPCPDLSAVNWVRHPHSCSKYFICYFGQPISMPDCPNNLVWSNMAKNCVPRSDRWDDCSEPTTPPMRATRPTRPTHMPVDRTWITHQRRTSKHTFPSTQEPVNHKISRSTSGSIYTTRPRITTTDAPTTRPFTTTTRALTTTTSKETTIEKIDYGPCRSITSSILPHPKNCHWYYNCTQDPRLPEWDYFERFSTECRYPQLFDPVKLKCASFLNVKCGNLYEPKDPCEYRENQCIKQNCVPCDMRYGACRGKANGIYPLESKKWTPMYVTCYLERNIAQDKCEAPTPIFSPDISDCVSMYDVPKEYNGLRPDCSFRKNGYYPDEQGRCGIYFSCQKREFQGYLECEPGKVFNPTTLRCDSADKAPPPCGTGPAPTCKNRRNGYYADSYGRCPYYYECRYGVFLRYHSCDYGSYDPASKDCVIPPQVMVQPCGLRDNPCQDRPSGRYPDLENRCFGYLECHNGFLIRNETCSPGQVFNEDLGRCGNAAAAPPPCGLAPTCRDRPDGRYAAPLRGCSFFFECEKRRFLGYRRCTYKEGGFFFNRQTGKCDFPQNICPPCGYKWYGCSARSYQ